MLANCFGLKHRAGLKAKHSEIYVKWRKGEKAD